MQTAVPVNRVFLSNMTQLWRHDARLAQRIDELPIDVGLEVTPSRAGPPTARVHTADRRSLYLHSRHDPRREADEFCRNLDAGDALCFVLCGFGLGYHVQALHERFGDSIVVFVAEPDLVTIKTALEHVDLSTELSTGRVVFLTDLDKAEMHDRLMRHSTPLTLGTCLVVPPAARELHADFHAACREAVTDFAAFARMSLVTLVKNAVVTCRNIAYNLPAYVATPPADLVRRRFAGCPAVLVAAGPSLSKNVDQLRGLQDRAVIIAAQTTLRPLLARGIRPHFVTSLDFSDLSRQFFENLDVPDDVVLVAEPKASWQVIDAFRGGSDAPGRREGAPSVRSTGGISEGRVAPFPTPASQGWGTRPRRVILLDNEFAHRCIGPVLAARTPMRPGATVMHLAFYLAEWLGSDPIIFIGQDLGFTGHCYYSPGVAIHRAWQPELGRYQTLEMKEWERIVRHREILRKVPAADGGEIYTDEQMFTYLEQFERDFAGSPARIIDATEGGVRKAGTVAMTLRDAASAHCRTVLDRARFDFLRANWHDAGRLADARRELARRRSELNRFSALCTETRDILDELTGLLDQPAQFNRRIVRVDELRTLVQQHQTLLRMVTDVSQMGELQKFSADRRIAADGADGVARAERQLQRDRAFVDALLDGCRTLGDILDGALHRFDAAIGASRTGSASQDPCGAGFESVGSEAKGGMAASKADMGLPRADVAMEPPS